jgi:hypothetical protein
VGRIDGSLHERRLGEWRRVNQAVSKMLQETGRKCRLHNVLYL